MYKEDNLNTQNPPLVNTSQMCQIIWHFQQKQGSTKQNGILGIFELQTRCWQHKKSSSLKTRNCEIIIWPINLLGHDSSGSHSSSFYFFAANIVFLIDLICQKVKLLPQRLRFILFFYGSYCYSYHIVAFINFVLNIWILIS